MSAVTGVPDNVHGPDIVSQAGSPLEAVGDRTVTDSRPQGFTECKPDPCSPKFPCFWQHRHSVLSVTVNVNNRLSVFPRSSLAVISDSGTHLPPLECLTA